VEFVVLWFVAPVSSDFLRVRCQFFFYSFCFSMICVSDVLFVSILLVRFDGCVMFVLSAFLVA